MTTRNLQTMTEQSKETDYTGPLDFIVLRGPFFVYMIVQSLDTLWTQKNDILEVDTRNVLEAEYDRRRILKFHSALRRCAE